MNRFEYKMLLDLYVEIKKDWKDGSKYEYLAIEYAIEKVCKKFKILDQANPQYKSNR